VFLTGELCRDAELPRTRAIFGKSCIHEIPVVAKNKPISRNLTRMTREEGSMENSVRVRVASREKPEWSGKPSEE